MGAVEDIAARLEAQIPSRTVYPHAVPSGKTIPASYLVVHGSEGSEESTRSADTVNVQTPAVWVTSVSRNENPLAAAREASWAAGRVRAALRNFRPGGRWSVRAEVSQPARRDESISATTFYAVEQFSVRTSL